MACRWIRYTGVLRGRPRLPDVFWAGFGSALRDDTALVDWATERLELDFDVADWRGWVDV